MLPSDYRRGASELNPSDASSFSPPAAFGPFRVLHQIGVGVLGPVFRTYEPARDRLAAVKVFRLDLTPEQAQALADELQRLVDAGLAHPSIVAPIAAGVEGGVAYLAEEYVGGESLDIAIRHYAPASIDKALPFIAQLAGAIDFARAAGIGHGTLHPRDIFVTPDEARATGFGIAGALEAVGQRAPVRRPYSAPERVAGEKWAAPADVFTLGAIGYELLTGRRIAGPVGRGDALELRGADPLVARLLAGPLARALAEDPARRYPGGLALARALEAAAEGEEEHDISRAAAVQPSLVDAIEEDAGVPGPELEARDEDFEPEPPFAAARGENAALPEPAVDAEDTREREPVVDRPYQGMIFGPPEPDLAREWTSDAAGGGLLDTTERREPMRPLPLALMLVAGLLVGFVAGYAVGTRGQPDAGAAATRPAPSDTLSDATTEPPAAAAPATAPAPTDTAAAVSDTPVPTTGTIVVRSSPERAGVVVDGAWRGRTPLTLTDLTMGPHLIRVVQRGYVARETEITLSPEQSRREVEMTLPRLEPPSRPAAAAAPRAAVRPPSQPPARAQTPAVRPSPAPERPAGAPSKLTGSVYVDSRPRGARVLIDGRQVGTTPVQVPGVPIGSHIVRMELAGHRPWSTVTRVVAGKPTAVTGSLEQIP